MISGLNFPRVFNAGTKTSSVVKSLEKIKAELRLLINQEINKLLFRPNVGVNVEYMLFSTDLDITRDFVITFVSEALVGNVSEVKVKDVSLKYKNDVLNIYIQFTYLVSSEDFVIDYMVEGVNYEQ